MKIYAKNQEIKEHLRHILNVNSKFQNNFKIIKFSNYILLFSLFVLLFT